MADVDLPEITEAKRLTLKPGDSLAVRLDREPDLWEADQIAERVHAITGVPVIVLGPGMDVEVVEAPKTGLQVEWAGGASLLKAMQQAVRSAGGDPRMFERKAGP